MGVETYTYQPTEQYQKKEIIVAYNPLFDAKAYQELGMFKNAPEYVRKKQMLDSYISNQVDTHLGERFNVSLSTNRYDIRSGRLYGENMHEPMMNMLTRGRDYLRINGDPIDHARESAEIDGFSEIERVFTDPETPVHTMMLSVSRPGKEGTKYKLNFYDVFTLKEDEYGSRYVEARRYTSGLREQESVEKVRDIDPYYFTFHQDEDLDVYFLSHPLEMKNTFIHFSSADALHAYFHKDHEFMTEEAFQQIKERVAILKHEYITYLAENPSDIETHLENFDAIQVFADTLAGYGPKTMGDIYKTTIPHNIGGVIQREDIQAMMRYLGKQEVRVVSTGCGSSGSVSKSGFDTGFLQNPADIMDVVNGIALMRQMGIEDAVDKYGSLKFECPHCHTENKREAGKLIENCNSCHRSVKC